MKKFFLKLAIVLWSFNLYASPDESYPSVDLDGLTMVPLNHFEGNKLKVYGHTSGAYSAGICRIIIRSADKDPAFSELADRFTFTRAIAGMPEEETTAITTNYALMFELMKVDYGFEHILISTKDGKSIGENITALFGNNTVGVIAGTCY